MGKCKADGAAAHIVLLNGSWLGKDCPLPTALGLGAEHGDAYKAQGKCDTVFYQ